MKVGVAGVGAVLKAFSSKFDTVGYDIAEHYKNNWELI
jgi:hypothetical protein